MRQEIEVAGKPIALECADFNAVVDTDKALTIDYSNLTGEYQNTVYDLNRVGALKSEAESAVREAELATKIYIGEFMEQVRVNQSKNGGFYIYKNEQQEEIKVKYSEKMLEKAHYTDKGWQEAMNELFKAQKAESVLNGFYWKLNDKLNKLNMFLQGTVPEEFIGEKIEDGINKLSGLGSERY